jgi:hypothetical protein
MPIASPTSYLPLVRAEWLRLDRGPRGLWSSYWEAILASDPGLRSLRMTIDIVFGGSHRVRVATEPVTTTSGTTGQIYHYAPGLQAEPEVVSEYQIGTAAASLRTLALTLDGRLVDPIRLLRERRVLAGWAEVSLQIDGGDFDQRLVLLRGDMVGGVVFGRPEEVVEIEIMDPETSQDRLLPPFVASSQGFFGIPLPSDTVGARYPIVWNGHPAVPALRIANGSLSWMVCWGHDHDVEVVFIYGQAYPSTSPIYPWSVNRITDALGVPFTQLVLSPGLGPIDDDLALYARLVRRSQVPMSVLDVLRDLFVSWSLIGPYGVSEELFGAAAARLPPLLAVQVYANGGGSANTARAIEFAEQVIAADLPMISFAWAGDGFGPIVTDRRRGQTVASLRRGQAPVIGRVSSIAETSKSDLRNSFTLRYGYDPLLDSFAKVATRNATNSLLCAMSQETVGFREESVIEAVSIHDDGTADYVLDWMVEHRALPAYILDYECLPEVVFKLKRGDNVLISDDDFEWTDERATVDRISYQRGRAVLTLRVWALYPDLPGGAQSGARSMNEGTG